METKKHATKKNSSVSMRKSKRKSENTLRQMKTKTIQSLCDVAKTVLREFIETHAYLKKQKSQINNLKEKEQTEPNVSERRK